MKEHPILFSAPMVRALLAGTKTQTRRVAKPKRSIEPMTDECPYGQPGDRLWVREAHRYEPGLDRFPPREIPVGAPIQYEAGPHADVLGGKLRPGMFMPRWASRITLEVTGVRVERLADISEADAVAEGLEPAAAGFWRLYGRDARGDMDRSPRVAYRSLWESINGPGSWDTNPWVWVVAFKRVQP